ncbi:hypothetical protein ON010_g3418 [Phytophthora cinnamomi]|nr:hypothetical protein ON010_g3418 [Phytophthora cinnamomi]
MALRGLRCFRSLWGSPSALKLASASTAGSASGSYASQLLAHIRRQGFDGIEASLGDLEALGGADAVLPLLAENDLELIVGVYSGWVDYESQNLHQQFEGVESHVKRFREQLEAVASFSQRPVRINAHSGSDHWCPNEKREFLSRAHDIERQVRVDGILAHETHRGRMFYSPWATLALLEEFPSLKLTLDFSHSVRGDGTTAGRAGGQRVAPEEGRAASSPRSRAGGDGASSAVAVSPRRRAIA